MRGALAVLFHCLTQTEPMRALSFEVSKALDALLNGLSVVAGKAEAQLGSGASEEQIADLSVKLTHGKRETGRPFSLLTSSFVSLKVEVQFGLHRNGRRSKEGMVFEENMQQGSTRAEAGDA